VTLYSVFRLYNGGKAPSASFVAVLNALVGLEYGGHSAQIGEEAGVERRNTIRLLQRMVEFGAAYQWREDGDRRELGHPPRVYYAATVEGRALADRLNREAGSAA
jgi:hypothetical protein